VKEQKEHINRRSFLKRAWAWIGTIAALEFAAITFNMFSPGKKRTVSNPAFIKTAGLVDEIVPGTVLPFKNGQFYLVRYADGGFLALSLICTHLGCSINWNSEKDQFMCPCHASAFDNKGNVISPPAPRALDTYKVIIQDGEVKVDTSRKIRRKKFEKSDLVYA
jgi:cytochrome b6-f complex iron-sulfur subunit